MIPQSALIAWRNIVPWTELAQVEQDLVLTKILIQIYSDPSLKETFAFRGGTALQKIFFSPPTRYSEDIDLVQIKKEPIGPAIDAIRKLLDPWLGAAKTSRKPGRFTLIYRFDSEVEPVQKMRVKVEINIAEHFTVLGFKKKPMKVESTWFSGSADLLTYEIEELMGTKLRALYQRKKGRDLFDFGMAFEKVKNLDKAKVVDCFKKYMAHEKKKVSRAQFESNLAGKMKDPAFTEDIHPLLASDAEKFDAHKTYEEVKLDLLSRLLGEPWKGSAK